MPRLQFSVSNVFGYKFVSCFVALTSTSVSVILQLFLVASTFATDAPDNVVSEAREAGQRTKNLCEKINGAASDISASPDASPEVKGEAEDIVAQAQSCLDQVGKAQQVVASGGSELAEDVQDRKTVYPLIQLELFS